MKRLLIAFIVLLSATPTSAQTTYLVIKSEMYARKTGAGLALMKIPMLSKEQCEDSGATLVASSRFDTTLAGEDGFECIEGK